MDFFVIHYLRNNSYSRSLYHFLIKAVKAISFPSAASLPLLSSSQLIPYMNPGRSFNLWWIKNSLSSRVTMPKRVYMCNVKQILKIIFKITLHFQMSFWWSTKHVLAFISIIYKKIHILGCSFASLYWNYNFFPQKTPLPARLVWHFYIKLT